MVFADTGYWIALLVRRDQLRSKVEEVAARLVGLRLITTDAVLIELLAHMSAFGSDARLQAANTVQDLLRDPGVVVVRQDPDLFERALDLYASRLDKAYSLTDCMGMVICQDMGISDVLTHDHHYEQEGFKILL